MESKIEHRLFESVVKMSHTEGLIQFIADQIPDAPCNKEEVSNFLDRAYPLELRRNVLVYKYDSGDKFIMENDKGVKACSEWLSAKLELPSFDIFQNDNLRKANEAQ